MSPITLRTIHVNPSVSDNTTPTRRGLEAGVLTIAESELALAAVGALRAGDTSAAEILRRLLRRVQPTLIRGFG